MLLIIGTSVVEKFEASDGFLKDYTPGVEVLYKSYPGMTLDSIQHEVLNELVYQNGKIDHILIFGLDCFVWKHVTISIEPAPLQLISRNQEFTVEKVVIIMDELVQKCQLINPNVKLYLVLPPLCDIYTYNKHRVRTAGYHTYFASDFSVEYSFVELTKQIRQVYNDLIKLEDKAKASDYYSWKDKRIINSQQILCKMYNPSKKRQEEPVKNPFLDFIDGKSNELNLDRATVDGFHPSPTYIYYFWQTYAWQFGPTPATPIYPRISDDHNSLGGKSDKNAFREEDFYHRIPNQNEVNNLSEYERRKPRNEELFYSSFQKEAVGNVRGADFFQNSVPAIKKLPPFQMIKGCMSNFMTTLEKQNVKENWNLTSDEVWQYTLQALDTV